jgi:hypothetical protein
MSKTILTFLAIISILLSGCVTGLTDEEKYIKQLIKNDCTKVQIDVDGNTCELDKDNGYTESCTEIASTQKLEQLKCVQVETPNTNCELFSGTMNEETYFTSPDAVVCKSNGCEIEERAYFPPVEKYELDTGYYTFDCVEKVE